MYFELGCELAQGEAQAQNTSKNDDLENGPIFVFDFFVESTYLAPNKAGMCLVLVDNFSEQPVEVRVLCVRYLLGSCQQAVQKKSASSLKEVSKQLASI